ncbi:hypothetical protein CYLTODRAFT_377995 [Cylindrobasidium torrendii FP15055 ss-10]|uniref:BTB domain-containing protein n=1 Tax=Cylindrobasidium torrendii FP15055 ss-10 TaxID=1314674 RepID=A0A0D7B7V5_9AGAR|nr:hypothetical protein CYLTODRAFT_377995 [Cylindrobasidium torrendii FP15055 ss-10]
MATPALAHDIPSPFDSIEKADLVIETVDGARLFVVKTFLIYASPFFANLFADSDPDETHQGIPLYRVPEAFCTMITLLQLSYPVYLVNQDAIVGTRIDRALMDAIEKYMMEGIHNHLKLVVEKAELVKENPLKVYAIARHLRWDDLARAAARACLNIDLLDAEHIPELEMITSREYQCLIRYFRRCAGAVTAAISQSVKTKSFSITAPLPDSLHIEFCRGCEYSNGNSPYRIGPLKVPMWIDGYIRDPVLPESSIRPGNCFLQCSERAVAAALSNQTNTQCYAECPRRMPVITMRMLEYMQGEIDRLIDQVPLELD